MHKVTKVEMMEGLSFEESLAELLDSLSDQDQVVIDTLTYLGSVYVIHVPFDEDELAQGVNAEVRRQFPELMVGGEPRNLNVPIVFEGPFNHNDPIGVDNDEDDDFAEDNPFFG